MTNFWFSSDKSVKGMISSLLASRHNQPLLILVQEILTDAYICFVGDYERRDISYQNRVAYISCQATGSSFLHLMEHK